MDVQYFSSMGAVHKWRHAIFQNFWAPSSRKINQIRPTFVWIVTFYSCYIPLKRHLPKVPFLTPNLMHCCHTSRIPPERTSSLERAPPFKLNILKHRFCCSGSTQNVALWQRFCTRQFFLSVKLFPKIGAFPFKMFETVTNILHDTELLVVVRTYTAYSPCLVEKNELSLASFQYGGLGTFMKLV